MSTSAKTTKTASKASLADSAPAVRYMDKATFRAAKKRVFVKHAELLRKLAR